MQIKNLYILLITVFFLNACTNSPHRIEPISKKQICEKEYAIYIIKHDWHLGLAIKSEKLNKIIPKLKQRFPKSEYYEIGWGDSDFYQANEMTTKLAFQALFNSKGSVLHIVGLDNKPTKIFKDTKIITLYSDKENYQNLLLFLKSSFKIDKNHNILPIKKGIYGDSQFYKAKGKYHILNTCNKWAANALYSTGYNISPIFKLTSSSVFDTLKDICPK